VVREREGIRKLERITDKKERDEGGRSYILLF
jgi:hypothetical protein